MTYKENSNTFLSFSGIPCPYDFVSGLCWGGYRTYRKMIYAPWVNGQTLKDVTSLTPELILNKAEDIFDWGPRIEITSQHVLLQLHNPTYNSEYVYRQQIEDTSYYVTYNPDIPYQYTVVYSTLYDDDVIYTIEWDSNGDMLYMYKVTFTESDYTREEIYNWEETTDLYMMWDQYSLAHVKNESIDCIVYICTYLEIDEGTTSHEYMWRIIVYNVESNEISDQWVIPSSINADLYHLPSASSSPSFYENKMMFTYTIESDSGGTIPKLAILTLDLAYHLESPYSFNASVTEWSNDYLSYDYVFLNCSTIDYSTETYYFTAWIEDDYYLFSAPVSTGVITKGSACGLIECFQGKNKGYSVDREDSPGEMTVRDVPTQTPLATLDIFAVHNNHYFESSCIIDIDNDIIWNITEDSGNAVLQGKSLVGGMDRNIIIEGWSNIPYTYTIDRWAWIRIINGMAVIMLSSQYSGYSGPYQQDFYLLKETI